MFCSSLQYKCKAAGLCAAGRRRLDQRGAAAADQRNQNQDYHYHGNGSIAKQLGLHLLYEGCSRLATDWVRPVLVPSDV